MIFKAPDKHLTDQEFFSYVKFFEYVIDKKELDDDDKFSLRELELGNEELGTIFNRIFQSAQVLEGKTFIQREDKFEKEVQEAAREASEKPQGEKKELLAIINKIKSGKGLKIEEIAKVSWIWYEVYKYIRFKPSEYKIPEEIEKIYRVEMEKYLDALINDKLTISKKNYYKFETQKRCLINLIEEDKKVSLYGTNFIIREKIDDSGVFKRVPDFCLIQTVYALQKLGYLKVINVWQDFQYPRDTFDSESADYRKTPARYVNVNLILEQDFIHEINAKYKKDHPKNVFEKFDEKRGILKFAGQEVELAKKGKETDAVLLMKTLLKGKDDEWKHNDEILTDWGYNDEDQKKVPKNKVYFAAQKVNTAVALKTQIEDFVECNTTKARINPKYRKIDE